MSIMRCFALICGVLFTLTTSAKNETFNFKENDSTSLHRAELTSCMTANLLLETAYKNTPSKDAKFSDVVSLAQDTALNMALSVNSNELQTAISECENDLEKLKIKRELHVFTQFMKVKRSRNKAIE
ncbi:hypothetical protein [Edwardsiella tarda]|uniref:hypothetical protein n=1 Tax=Edwardsiella tarda TaxID=636 RepID=UPI00351C3F0A